MNNFTNFSKFAEINEAAKRTNNEVLSVDAITAYIQAVSKSIPKQVIDIVYLTAKYSLTSQKDIDDIRNANKGQLKKLAFKYSIPDVEMEDLWKSLKELKSNLRLLPQYQTPSEREAFMKGKLQMTDITIDLDTSTGRNACAKQYMPMIHKIVNEFVGKSRLSKPELMSAAMIGFTAAMNDWRKNGDESTVPFKTYAAYRVKHQIRTDINEYSYVVKTNWYGVQKMGSAMLTAISFDGMMNDDGEFMQDHLKELGTEDPNYNLSKSEEDNWAELYKIIETSFSQRDIDIFYRYFGLKGHNKEKAKDIAKSMGISPSLVTGIVKMGILKKLKNNKKAMEILQDLQASYNESLMFDIMNLDKNMMLEAILADDTFILLEELTKWSNKDVYINTLETAFKSMNRKEAQTIKDILMNDFDYLDKMFKANKKLIIRFLSLLYPTESFAKKTDVALLEYMDELCELYKKHNK